MFWHASLEKSNYMVETGVFGYAAIHARVRAMYSRMLSPAELAGLFRAVDYESLISLLRRTVYGSYLTRVEDKDLTPRRAVYQIKLQMADDYATIIKAAPDHICPLITQYYRNFEVDNLKAVLRGIVSGASWDRIRYVLFPLGSMTVLPAEAMVETGRVANAVELLRNTPYFSTLSHAMERYTAEQSLFPLEVALDLNYWREIWISIQRFPKNDRDYALRIIGALLDMNNLMWVIRYRVYHNLSEEELINYTLPFGYRVRDVDIRAIAAGADIAQIVRRIYPDLTDVEGLLMEPRKGLPLLEAQLQRYVEEQCRAAFVGYPFHIGIPLAYLVLKKMEIQDLTALIEAKAAKIPVESYQPYLLMNYATK
jgi:V/A-type H+-transporting ATPase subunit C